MKMQLSNYIEQHLIKYIKQQLHDGYSKEAITGALLSKGHHVNMIDRAILFLEKDGYKQIIRHKNPQKHNLDEDIFNYTVNLLTKYIRQQKHEGYSIHDIRTALLNFGHSYDIINDALDIVDRKNIAPIKKKKINYVPHIQVSKPKELHLVFNKINKYIFSICALLVFLFLMMMSILSNTSFIVVAIAFLPTILTLIAIESVFLYNKTVNLYYFAIPLVFTIALKVLTLYDLLPIFKNMSVDNIVIANLLVSCIITSIYLLTKND